jgi:myo-inositol 2-dehydrogenase/D-chiro-inositol 1-dehydrogenase
VEIYDKNGSRREIVDTFLERFEESFVSQTQSFVNHVIEGKKMSVTLKDALEATRVGVAMTKSFMLKKEIVIDR